MDFSTFNFKKLTDRQWGELHMLADEVMSNPDLSFIDYDQSAQYFKTIDESDKEFGYFDEVRVEIRTDFARSGNPQLRNVFGKMLGVKPETIEVSEMKTNCYIHLHVRGKPENEIITVKV